jgi:hypothetical protein
MRGYKPPAADRRRTTGLGVLLQGAHTATEVALLPLSCRTSLSCTSWHPDSLPERRQTAVLE